MRVYIAGPISGNVLRVGSPGLKPLTVEEKMQRFTSAFFALKEEFRLEEYDIVNPLEVGNDTCLREDLFELPPCLKPGEVPNGQGEHSWACYMKHDLAAMLECDTIALLPQWWNSRGAALEAKVAQELGYRRIDLGVKDEQVYIKEEGSRV